MAVLRQMNGLCIWWLTAFPIYGSVASNMSEKEKAKIKRTGITFYLPEELKRRVKIKLAEESLQAGPLLRELLTDWLTKK